MEIDRNALPTRIVSSRRLNVLGKALYRNLPNMVSMLGVLALSLFFVEDSFRYFIGLVIFNNIMDDLDGILARELHLSSEFGARLDNVADAVSHIVITMAVGIHYGGIVLPFSLVAAAAILVRVVQRLAPVPPSGVGSPTNELMRHLLLLVILQEIFEFDAAPFLVVVFLLNSVSMLVPYAMPYMVRTRAKRLWAIVGVNVVLVLAWAAPPAAPVVAAAFFGTYLYSFVAGGIPWVQNRSAGASAE